MRGQRPGVSPRRPRQQIGRQLLEDELVVGQVGVERPGHIVAIGEGIEQPPLFLQTDIFLGVGIAGDVEPMPAPALAVMGRGQQPLDHPLEGAGRSVGFRNAAISAGVGGRPIRSNVARRSSVRRSAGGEGARPFCSSRARMKRSTGERSNGHRARPATPAGAPAVPPNVSSRRRSTAGPADRQLRASVSGQGAPCRTHSVSSATAAGRQAIVGRHLQIGVGVADGGNQPAFAGRAGDDDRAMFAPLEQCRAGVEPQLAFLLFRSVALLAMLDQQRPDCFSNCSIAFGRSGGGGGSFSRRGLGPAALRSDDRRPGDRRPATGSTRPERATGKANRRPASSTGI